MRNIRHFVGGVAAVISVHGQSLTWTERNTGVTPGHWLVAAAWGEGRFAVAAVAQDLITRKYSSQVAFSHDGVAWNVATLPTVPTTYVTDIVHGGGLWVVSLAESVNSHLPSSNPNMLTSPNGTDWTPHVAGIAEFGTSRLKVAHTEANGKSLFVSVGSGIDGHSAVYSTDGAVWSRAAVPPGSRGSSAVSRTHLAAGNGIMVAGGGFPGGRVYSTDNGVIWATRLLPDAYLTSSCLGLTFAGGEFIALIQFDDLARIYTSADGATWRAGPIVMPPTNYGFSGIAASTSVSAGNAIVLLPGGVWDASNNAAPAVLFGRSTLETWIETRLGSSVPGGQSLFAYHANNLWLVGNGNTQLFTAADTSGTSGIAYLNNLSVRAAAGSGSETLIVGFTLGGGTASTAKNILVRGIGPTLATFGVTEVLPDPAMTVFYGNTPVATNDDWDPAAGISALAAAVGAFPLPAGSRDSAILGSGFEIGGYTVQLTGKAGAQGNALVELYDTAAATSITATTARFINVSARTFGGTGNDTVMVGLNVAGTGSRRLVIRAVGPGLDGFGVTGTMSDPKIELYRGTFKIGENDNWDLATLSVQQAVGAFALASGSRDAVLVSNFAPGGYTAQVTGGSRGIVLLEVYEAP